MDFKKLFNNIILYAKFQDNIQLNLHLHFILFARVVDFSLYICSYENEQCTSSYCLYIIKKNVVWAYLYFVPCSLDVMCFPFFTYRIQWRCYGDLFLLVASLTNYDRLNINWCLRVWAKEIFRILCIDVSICFILRCLQFMFNMNISYSIFLIFLCCD